MKVVRVRVRSSAPVPRMIYVRPGLIRWARGLTIGIGLGRFPPGSYLSTRHPRGVLLPLLHQRPAHRSQMRGDESFLPQ